jgi:glycosyltransferase involved in cell wall biosynthesis
MLDREDLASLYRQASVYLQTSNWESFCMPAVEALTFGTPVVATPAYALPEVVGRGALYCSKSPDDVARKTLSLLDDDDLRERKSHIGRHVANRYSWQKTAEKTLESYTNLWQE